MPVLRNSRVFKKVIYLSMTVSLVLTSPFNWAESTTQTSSNLERIKQKIQVLAETLSLTKNAHERATEALQASEISISESRKILREIEQAQQRNKQVLGELSINLLRAQNAVAIQRQSIAKQLKSQYARGRLGHLQLLLQQQDVNRIARDMHYLGYITQARWGEIEKLQSNLTEIERIQAQSAERIEKNVLLAEQYTRATKQLEQEKKVKVRLASQLTQKIESQQQQLERLRRDAQNLTRLIERLDKQSKKEAEAKRKKQPSSKKEQALSSGKTDKESNPKRTSSSNISDERTSDNRHDGLPFSRLRGTLPLPVSGDVTNRFGVARADTGVTWSGIFIRAHEGREVKSIAKGMVVFADWMRGFGNLIIIDHGEGYMSLYGNNESLFKNTGQSVHSGEAIASVGNSGGNEENGVYYELRKNSTPFDPMAWSKSR